MSATEAASDIGAARTGAWASVVRWMARHKGEGYTLTFSVVEGDGIRGARYIARMITPAHGELGGEGADSPAAALLALAEELRDHEARGADWFIDER